jgi:hypothetical protein
MADNRHELLDHLVRGWQGKLDIAIQHKKDRFQDIADQCMGFFSGAVGFMYDPKYMAKYVGGAFQPKFKITLNKAFEIVALFGPLIYNRNPTRLVGAPEGIHYGPELFGNPDDPNVQAQYQQATAQDENRKAALDAGCQALERYLNYTPNEQPNGGLKQASEDACTEALIKGRGCLWSEPYKMPGSNRVLTGSFYDSVDRLLIDPDSESANFGEAFWIARQCIEPHWKAEKDRGLPYGSLRNKNNLESADSQGSQRGNPAAARQRTQGRTNDLISYTKIWSIGGVGTRLSGTSKVMQEAFDEVVGDYAYLEIAKGVPWPLNMSKDRFLAATDEEVKQAFSWPVPYWLDQRWPCAMLDFYRQPNCSWPISPLRPGLGELVALNIIISHLTHHIYQNSRTLVAVLKSAQKDVQGALESGKDLAVFGIPEILKDIDSLIKFIQGPAVNYDVWKIIDHLFELFDKRVGLSELMYAMNPGAASRTTADAETKRSSMAIRPDHMAAQVEAWQVDVARNEKLCAYFSGVNGESVKPLVGDVGAWIFDQTFASADPESVILEMNCTIAAGSAKKPDRQRDAANLREIYQPLSIQLTQAWQVTGDPEPLNNLNRKMGEAMEVDMEGLAIGPPPPPPPPEEQQPDPAQEAKAASIQQDMQIKAAQTQQDMQLQAIGQQQKLLQDQQKLETEAVVHQQNVQQKSETHQADMMMKLAKMRMDRLNVEHKIMMDQEKAKEKPKVSANGKK